MAEAKLAPSEIVKLVEFYRQWEVTAMGPGRAAILNLVNGYPHRVRDVFELLIDQCAETMNSHHEEVAQQILDTVYPPAVPALQPKQPVIDELRLVGSLDRILSEMKFVFDRPEQFDTATFQTLKHHVEDMELFTKYARGKLGAMKKIASLPPVAVQGDRGY